MTCLRCAVRRCDFFRQSRYSFTASGFNSLGYRDAPRVFLPPVSVKKRLPQQFLSQVWGWTKGELAVVNRVWNSYLVGFPEERHPRGLRPSNAVSDATISTYLAYPTTAGDVALCSSLG